MEGGYLKIYRSMLDWEWYKDTNTCRLWMHILLKANWKDGRFMGTEVPSGSFITSYAQLSEETGLSVKSVRTCLEHLKSTNEVTIKSTSRWTHIFVEKWADFQSDDVEGGKAKGKVSGKQVANDWQTTGKQVATIEEGKNNKNNKNIYISPFFDLFWASYPKKVGKNDALKAFNKINPNEELVQKMVSVIEQAKKTEQWQKQGGQFIPNPSTWLNQGRWEDDIATYSKRTSIEGRVIEDDRFANIPF